MMDKLNEKAISKLRLEKVLTTFEAAKLCRVSVNTIKSWIKRNLLKAYCTAGGHHRIEADDLHEFCNKHEIPLMKRGKMMQLERKDTADYSEYKGAICRDCSSGRAATLAERNRCVDILKKEVDRLKEKGGDPKHVIDLIREKIKP